MRVLSSLLAGYALGACATAGVALLLYTGQGFLRTAAFLIALVVASLAAGIWVGGALAGSTRGRWALLILALLAAGLFSGFWTGTESLRETGIGGALAVLLILAEPAYLAGSLFVMLSARARHSAVPAAATAGAALGVLLAGSFLIPNFDAPLVFFGAAVLLVPAGWLQTAFDHGPGQEDLKDMTDHVVLVTGVGHPGQLGYAIARRFLAAGARVFITGRSGNVTAIAAELGPPDRCAGLAADLLDDDAIARLSAAIDEHFGRLDAVLNVAGGLGVVASVQDTSAAAWRREIERNADTTYRVSRACLPMLRRNGGAIVSFASPAALRAPANMSAYSAGKAAVVALTRSLAIEERDHRVRVNAIAPGMIDTEQNRATVDDADSVRWVTREQVADVALFLVSEAGSGINGEVLRVMGDGVA